MLPLPRQSSWICDRSVLQSRPEWLAIHTWSAAPQLEPIHGSCRLLHSLPTSTNKIDLTYFQLDDSMWQCWRQLWLKLKIAEAYCADQTCQTDPKRLSDSLCCSVTNVTQVPAVLRWYWGRACWFHPSSSICPCALSSSKKWFLWWDLPVSTPQPLFDSMYQKMDIETATFEEGQRFELMCLFAYCLG